ncbi:helix-turn-helix transcriptional regulator [Streptomyces sp. MS06]|uniref:helix-turn-helix transcriptional regulator n=1 Tax=Streptomyces sp. MS06 TaxID=3385974 RepID=UPI0039A3EE73
MWNRYGEALSLDDIADSAVLSKFYFSRVFGSVTGTSPGRFLAAIRLFRAKNLLLETTESVTDIAYAVGYNSLGTFTSRFTRSVGASPGRYRMLSLDGGHHLDGRPAVSDDMATVTGSVELPEMMEPLRVYVGAFASPVVEGLPVACDLLSASGDYTLRNVPPGTWYVRAAAVSVGDVDPRPWLRKPLFLGKAERLTVRPNTTYGDNRVRMNPARLVDTPILLALPELDNWGTLQLDTVA